jgi:hypothetical protein
LFAYSLARNIAESSTVMSQVEHRNRPPLIALCILAALFGQTSIAQGQQEQERNAIPPDNAITASFPEESVANNVAACIQPAPMVRLEDYDGPLKKVVGAFARPLERKTVQPKHYKPGAKLCTLKLKDKFVLFVQDSLDPGTFLSAAFDAGLDHAQSTSPSYGQGAEGYGRRFGAEFAGQASSRFFKDFAYPTLFGEDPRYYRLAHGTFGKRFVHALEHAVVAHRDDGTRMFNFSEWLGTATTVALSNTYHPDNQRGFAPAAERVGSSIVQDMGFDVLREFWPEVSKTLRLPFRGEPSPVNADSPTR